MSVVKQAAKWGGTCIAGGFVLGKFVTPYLSQLQRIKTEELISDERYVRAKVLHFIPIISVLCGDLSNL
jgi:hypothetical protein